MYSILNLIMLRKAQTAHCIIAYISSVTITRVRPSIRFLDPRPSLPLPINFVQDHLFFSKGQLYPCLTYKIHVHN